MVNKKAQVSPDYNPKPKSKLAIILITVILVIILTIILIIIIPLFKKPAPLVFEDHNIEDPVKGIINNCLSKKEDDKNINIEAFIKNDISICNQEEPTKQEHCEFVFYVYTSFENSFSDCESIKDSNLQEMCNVINSYNIEVLLL